jgi:hypothetical protein
MDFADASDRGAHIFTGHITGSKDELTDGVLLKARFSRKL